MLDSGPPSKRIAVRRGSKANEVPVIHVLPIDRRGASAVNLGGDDRYLRRSQLARSCAQLASLIAEQLAVGGRGSRPVSTPVQRSAPLADDRPAPQRVEPLPRPPAASQATESIDFSGRESKGGQSTVR